MTRPDTLKIETYECEEGDGDCDNMYCAIVMGYNDCNPPKSNGWYNTGIVFREATPQEAFAAAYAAVIEKGWKF